MPSTTVTASFSLFPLLAPELRLKIWQHACPSRIVSVRYMPESDSCVSSSKPPAVLQACRESREEALRTYTLTFGTQSSSARIYFNPYRDILYFPRYRQMGYDETLRDFRSFLNEDERDILGSVQTIAIDHVDPAVKRPWESYNKAAFMRCFPALQEVLLILRDGATSPVLELGEEFGEPKEKPEHLLKIWVDFRQSLAVEEKSLEGICRVEGKEYVRWTLPTVGIRSRIRRADAGLQEGLGALRL